MIDKQISTVPIQCMWNQNWTLQRVKLQLSHYPSFYIFEMLSWALNAHQFLQNGTVNFQAAKLKGFPIPHQSEKIKYS